MLRQIVRIFDRPVPAQAHIFVDGLPIRGEQRLERAVAFPESPLRAVSITDHRVGGKLSAACAWRSCVIRRRVYAGVCLTDKCPHCRQGLIGSRRHGLEESPIAAVAQTSVVLRPKRHGLKSELR